MSDAKPSKSERKREYLALQALGEQLIDLAPEQLGSIDTDEYLIEQVLLARKIRSHSALRRQKQLIGKIMRDIDPQPIRLALEHFGSGHRQSKAVFKRAEQWRDRLAESGSSVLVEFASENKQTSKALTQLVDDHQSSQDSERRRLIRRRMFREIHRILTDGMQNTGD